MKRRAAVLLLALAACPPESEHPLSPPEKAAVDKALLGNWVGDDGHGEKLELQISVKSGGVLAVNMPARDRVMKAEAHASSVGALKLLNVRLLDDDDGPSGYIFMRYELGRDGVLKLWTLEAQPVRDAVQKGVLKGRSMGGGTGDMLITDTPQKIAAFLKAGKPDELFESFGVFKKQP